MKLNENMKVLIEMSQRKGLYFMGKSKGQYIIMKQNGDIFCQANTQKELVEKMKTIFFDYEIEDIYKAIK